MCGIPAGGVAAAVARLMAAEHKVALSEQPTDPSGERPLPLMTPGTAVDADVLAEGRPNNLAVALAEGEAVGFAWIDLSTGEGGTCMASLDGCGAALSRIALSEILVARWPGGSEALAVAVRGSGARSSDLSRPELTPAEANRVLAQAYGRERRDALQGFSPPELGALAALLDYVRAVVGQLSKGLLPPRPASVGDTVEIDGPTLRGLEVLTSASGREGSLLSVLDRTVIAPGARLLVRQLCASLTSLDTIRRRFAMMRFLVGICKCGVPVGRTIAAWPIYCGPAEIAPSGGGSCCRAADAAHVGSPSQAPSAVTEAICPSVFPSRAGTCAASPAWLSVSTGTAISPVPASTAR